MATTSVQESQKKLPEGWTVCKSRRHPDLEYYHNTRTGETSWVFPKSTNGPSQAAPRHKGSSRLRHDITKNDTALKTIKKKSYKECSSYIASQGRHYKENTKKRKSAEDGELQRSTSSMAERSTLIAVRRTAGNQRQMLRRATDTPETLMKATGLKHPVDRITRHSDPVPIRSVRERSRPTAKIGVCTPSSAISTTRYKLQCLNQKTEENVMSDEEMEWEEVEMMTEICNVREELWNSKMKYLHTLTDMKPTDIPWEPHSLVIVIDTNILISSKDIIDNLKTVQVPHYENIVIFLPWMVLQELDALKTGGSTQAQRKGQKSVIFLESLLREKHPRLHCQLASDAAAATREFNGQVADDSILQCCLQVKKTESTVVLVSNDRNLCNKALVHQIPAFSSDAVLQGIRTLSNVHKKDVFSPSFLDQRSSLQPLSVNREVPVSVTRNVSFQSSPLKVKEEAVSAENLLENMKNALSPCFTKLLHVEMEKIYGNMWLQIVKKKPPWTFMDLLFCLVNHWIAVFSFFLPKSAYNSLIKIQDIVKKVRPSNADIGEALSAGLAFLMPTKAHNDYDNTVSKALEKLQILLLDWEKKGANKSGHTRKSAIDFEAARAVLMDILTESWSHMNNCCGFMLDQLNIPNGLPYISPAKVPSAEECIQFVTSLHSIIVALVPTMKHLLDGEESELTHATAFGLILRNLMGLISSNHLQNPILDDILEENTVIEFIHNTQDRERLLRGWEQLQQYEVMVKQILKSVSPPGS